MKTICSHPFEEYIEMVKSFHGHVAPGMLIGGFMVDLAMKHLPEGELWDALCETPKCLPDAIQLLTPCTVGNGWLKVINLGRYALTLYEKYEGQGVRVFIDPQRLEPWPEIKTWFFKLKPKREQDRNLLLEQIQEAGSELCAHGRVKMRPEYLVTRRRRGFSVCPLCHEAYPSDDGSVCLGCRGDAPYLDPGGSVDMTGPRTRGLKSVPVEEIPGKRALHDMTQVIPGLSKGPAFKRNQLLEEADICRLQKIGRQRVYVTEENPSEPDWIHEDEAAHLFARAMAGEGVGFTERPSEGKATLIANRDGLFVVDERRLEAFNMLPGVACASRHGYSVVNKGDTLAGTRAVPLFLHREDFQRAMAVLEGGFLFQVRSMRRARVGVLVTGTELFRGLVQDRFVPIIREKVEGYGCRVVESAIVPDDRSRIAESVRAMLRSGVDLLVTTAGLSVDPDDVTRQALLDAGAEELIHGAPILPGNMTLLARIGEVRVMGVPACGLYHPRTSFDLLLPRVLAGVPISRQDLAKMGHGSLCLECETCSFPRCPFGK